MMTKIAIISQPEEGVLIDVGGCSTLQEVTQQLISTLQTANQFWESRDVDLDLGELLLGTEEVRQIMSIMSEVALKPRHVFTQQEITKAALAALNISSPDEETLSWPLLIPNVSDNCSEQISESVESFNNAKDLLVSVVPSTVLPNTPSTKVSEAPETKNTVPAVLYLRQTLRSGQAVSHKGHLVIIGDVNPGAEVTADGDITVWGALRGMAHAGTAGNTKAEIRALRLQPIQLRIAHAIARSPDRNLSTIASWCPEVARIVDGKIHITSSPLE